jgi:hypothetical protein
MSTEKKTKTSPPRAKTPSIKVSSEDARRFERAKQRIEENAALFEDFVQADGLSKLDEMNVLVLLNATDEVGKDFVVEVLGLPSPPKPRVPKRLRRAVHLGATWGLFVVPRDVFTGTPLRAAIDSPAPFGCRTVLLIEDAGTVLLAWSPDGRGSPQA